MRSYYVHNGNAQNGPFTLEELGNQNLKKETLVWFEGASDWSAAGEIDELKSLFAVIPPPFHKSSSSSKAGEAVGKTVASSGTLRAVGVLAILVVLGYGGYNIYQSKKADDRLVKIEQKKSYVRENIHTFVTTSNNAYHISGLGGINGLSISVANNTDYVLENVRVVVRYIKASGETWKEEPLDFVLVGPHKVMELRAPDSDRGTSVDYMITEIKSGALGL